jgi:hypothetical protein
VGEVSQIPAGVARRIFGKSLPFGWGLGAFEVLRKGVQITVAAGAATAYAMRKDLLEDVGDGAECWGAGRMVAASSFNRSLCRQSGASIVCVWRRTRC